MSFGSEPEGLFLDAAIVGLSESDFFLLLRPNGQMAISSPVVPVSNRSPPLARRLPRRKHVKIDSLKSLHGEPAGQIASGVNGG